MSDGYAILDAHAYVDNSLSPTDRAAFEAALRRDAKLRARVEAWLAQNDAIRLAFGAAARPRTASAPVGATTEDLATASPPTTPVERASPILRSRPQPPGVTSAQTAPKPRGRAESAALGLLAFFVGLLGVAGGPVDPREALMARADAALRASAAFADGRLDFISDNPRAVSAWLASRFARLSPERIAPPGWSLRGVRVVPGLASTAALILYEDALGGRGGLLLEPMDALPDLPPIASRDADETIVTGAESGFAYAAVGPTHSGVGALVPEGPAD